MKLLVIDNYGPDQQASMAQYSEMLVQFATEIGWQVEVLRPPRVFGTRAGTTAGFAKFLGYIDKYVIASIFLRRQWRAHIRKNASRPVVHIADHANAVYLPCFRGGRVFVTCHDLIAIRRAKGAFGAIQPQRLTGRIQQHWILKAIRECPRILFVSATTRSQFGELTMRHADTLPVIHNPLVSAWNHLPQEQCRQALSQFRITVPQRFIMHHGSNAWYKNRSAVLRVFRKVSREFPELGLVFSGDHLSRDHSDWIAMERLSDRVVDLGRLKHEAVEALYNCASLFLFPSWSEGFGWPPLEAQACGCPVIASKIGIFQETLGNSAVLCAPDSIEEMADAVRTVIGGQTEVAAALRRAGFLNVNRFNREHARRAYQALWESEGVQER